MEYTTIVSETGMLNLPKELLLSSGLQPGSQVTVSSFGDFWTLRPSPKKTTKKRTILDWEGAFKPGTGPNDFDALIQQVVLKNDQC